MQNKRRRALAEKVFKIADDYKYISSGTRLNSRSKEENEAIERFKIKMAKYSAVLTSAASKIARGGVSFTQPELRAERFLEKLSAENYTVMIYDGEIGEQLAEILGANTL